VLPKGPVVRVLLVHCCSVEPWVCPCANKHCNFQNSYGRGSRHMKTHGFEEHKLRAQRNMVCNRISTQGLLPLKNTNETMAQKLTRQRGMTTTQPQKLQTATTGLTTCKVEEQQTSEQPQRGPTTTAGPQLCKVESNKKKDYGTNQ
jgi:hypothetical protein